MVHLHKLCVGAPTVVHLVKAPRRHDVIYSGICDEDDGDHIVVRARRTLPTVSIGPASFDKGDLFIEHYWRTKFYGIYQVMSPTGVIKGLYASVSCPAVTKDGHLFSRDLDLDLWVPSGDRVAIRLDEDEFLASGLREADPALAQIAEETIIELERMLETGTLFEMVRWDLPKNAHGWVED